MGRLNFTISEVKNLLEHKLHMQPRTAGERNYWFYLEGKKYLRVTLPHGRGQLKPGTANSIVNQLKLCKDQFSEFVSCKWALSDYVNIIRGKIAMGLLPFD